MKNWFLEKLEKFDLNLLTQQIAKMLLSSILSITMITATIVKTCGSTAHTLEVKGMPLN